ncbi:unnamed protein product [Leuciscus chuanchicus]
MKYEQKLKEQKVEQSETTAKLRKRLQTEIENGNLEIDTLKQEEQELQSQIISLENDITKLEATIQNKDGIMQDKEKSIYDLKRGNSALNNSLEFTKFSYELTKEELAAKNHQTEELKEQIQEMAGELKEFHETNAKLELKIESQRQRFTQRNEQVRRYSTDTVFQSKMKENMKRYSTDALFQKKRYSTDALFQKKMKEYSKKRYSTDALFQKKKEYIKKRYSTDTLFQRKMKAYMVKRYAGDPEFRAHHILRCTLRKTQKCAGNVAYHVLHRLQCALRIKKKYTSYIHPRQETPQPLVNKVMESAIHAFRCKIQHGPTHVCTVCHRALFPNQVKPPQERTDVFNCSSQQTGVAELDELNVLERQLIAKILPFAKIVALPKGQQRAVRGAVVCVPSEMEKTVNSLPRPRSEAQLLQVKLKRHVKFKGYQHFHTVNMHNVLAALSKLKAMHSEYRDISIRESAVFESPLEEEADVSESHLDEEAEVSEMQQEVDVAEQDEQHVSVEEKDELRPGLTLDTCMQPPDIGHEILSYGEGIFSIAPAQGQKPVGFFKIPKLEAMAFPVQFPTGQNSIDEERQISISPSMYFNARLFSVDTRFAKDQSYLFFAQFVIETQLARNSMSIQLRKGKPLTRDGRRISNRLLQDNREIERLVHNKDATRFMQPLRGSPSAAEMRWPEVITAIKAQQGEHVDFSELDWTTKCEILRSNPVTVMRMFEKRVDALMTHLLLSPAQPIGKVEDYFYRVEFQARGSPHIHLVWIKDAPEFEKDSDKDVCDFIDRNITCQLPDPSADPELHKIVTEVQLHSRNHSKSCKKGNLLCRFGFPKLPVSSTTITRPRPQRPEEEDDTDTSPSGSCMFASKQPQRPEEEQEKAQKQAERRKLRREAAQKAMSEARAKLKPVWDQLNDPQASFDSLSDLLTKSKLSIDDYNDNVEALSNANVILLKRDPKESWVNGYNPDLLRAWNANMDIQFVLDAFSCVMYMLSYISKPEHEMGDLLKNVIKSVRETNVSEEDEMKQIMQAYSKHRQVSAQESVARTLPLKKCSRSVVFLPTDDDTLKMSLPLSILQNKNPDSEDVWMSGMIDKYRARPQTHDFEKMCLADFASECRIVYGQQTKGKNVHQLLNGMGFFQKRTSGKAAVISELQDVSSSPSDTTDSGESDPDLDVAPSSSSLASTEGEEDSEDPGSGWIGRNGEVWFSTNAETTPFLQPARGVTPGPTRYAITRHSHTCLYDCTNMHSASALESRLWQAEERELSPRWWKTTLRRFSQSTQIQDPPNPPRLQWKLERMMRVPHPNQDLTLLSLWCQREMTIHPAARWKGQAA